MRLVSLDFETYYDAEYSLSTQTTEAYLRDPRREVICLTATVDDGEVLEAWGYPDVRALLETLGLDREGTITVAHNARFDGSIIEWWFGIKVNFLVCTILMMREVGLSRLISESLESLAEFLIHMGHDVPRKGHIVRNARGLRLEDMSPQFRAKYGEYCRVDTMILRAAARVLLPLCPPDALQTMNMTLQMYTRPIFELDKPLLDSYLVSIREKRQAALMEMAQANGHITVEMFLKQLRSKPKLADLLRSVGVEPPMKVSEKKTAKAREANPDAPEVMDYAFAKNDLDFKALLEHPNPKVVAIVMARMENNTSQAESRTISFLAVENPMPIPLQYAKAHCVPGETEVLTRRGWVSLETWRGGEIMQAHTDGSLVWASASRYEGPEVDEWFGWNDIRFPCLFTAGHTMAARSAWGKKTGFQAKTVHQCAVPTRARNAVAGVVKQDETFTALQMQCIIMVQADGSYTNDGRALRFHFKKARKVARCKQLLSQNGIMHSHSYASDGTVTIRVGVAGVPAWLQGRKVLTPELWATSAAALAAAVQESVLWDGTERRDGVRKYTTNHRGNAEWMVTAAHLSGQKAIISQDRDMFAVTFCTRGKDSAILFREKFFSTNTVQRAYCAKTQTGFWLARYSGVVFITGNTGRYGGDEKLNVQNLPKRNGDKTLRTSMMAPAGYEIGGADSSQIEARLLAYAAQERDLLAVFETGGDPYAYMAETIYREDAATIKKYAKLDVNALPYDHEDRALHQKFYTMRNVGKETILGSGYQMSGNKFALRLKQLGIMLRPTKADIHAWALDLKRAEKWPADRTAQGILFNEYLQAFHLSEAKRINWVYRGKHDRIKGFWGTCEWVLSQLCQGASGHFGGADGKLFYFDGQHKVLGEVVPAVMLPNGFWIVYPELRTFVDEDSGYVKYSYMRRTGRNMVESYIYGGALTENLIQGLAFAVLKWQAVRIHKYIPVKMNVHDEWMSVYQIEMRERVKQVYMTAMRATPPWLPRAPLDCEFTHGRNYGAC